MRFISLTCPNCGASLEIDDGIDTYTCQHCGYTIILDGLDPDVLHEHSKIAQMKFRHQSEIEQMKLRHEHRKEMADRAAAKEKRDRIENNVPFLFYFALLLLLGLASLGFFGLQSCQREGIEASIEQHVRDEKFDEARKDLIKLKEQKVNSSSSDKDDKEQSSWEEKITYYEQLIEDKERESVSKSDTKAFAPKSSEAIKEMSGEEAKKLFEATGFTNIKMVQIDGSAGWFHPAKQVDHVQFAGKTEFTEDDYADLDSEIVIYHFKE